MREGNRSPSGPSSAQCPQTPSCTSARPPLSPVTGKSRLEMGANEQPPAPDPPVSRDPPGCVNYTQSSYNTYILGIITTISLTVTEWNLSDYTLPGPDTSHNCILSCLLQCICAGKKYHSGVQGADLTGLSIPDTTVTNPTQCIAAP